MPCSCAPGVLPVWPSPLYLPLHACDLLGPRDRALHVRETENGHDFMRHVCLDLSREVLLRMNGLGLGLGQEEAAGAGSPPADLSVLFKPVTRKTASTCVICLAPFRARQVVAQLSRHPDAPVPSNMRDSSVGDRIDV